MQRLSKTLSAFALAITFTGTALAAEQPMTHSVERVTDVLVANAMTNTANDLAIGTLYDVLNSTHQYTPEGLIPSPRGRVIVNDIASNTGNDNDDELVNTDA